MMTGGRAGGGQAPRSDLRQAGARRRDVARTPDAENSCTSSRGILHCGPNGGAGGHFVKMLHNGESSTGSWPPTPRGWAILALANVVKAGHAGRAETNAAGDPEHYQYDLNLPDIARVCGAAASLPSWLPDLSASRAHQGPRAEGLRGSVSNSGRGAGLDDQGAIDEACRPTSLRGPVRALSSRGEADFADKRSRPCAMSFRRSPRKAGAVIGAHR